MNTNESTKLTVSQLAHIIRIVEQTMQPATEYTIIPRKVFDTCQANLIMKLFSMLDSLDMQEPTQSNQPDQRDPQGLALHQTKGDTNE